MAKGRCDGQPVVVGVGAVDQRVDDPGRRGRGGRADGAGGRGGAGRRRRATDRRRAAPPHRLDRGARGDVGLPRPRPAVAERLGLRPPRHRPHGHGRRRRGAAGPADASPPSASPPASSTSPLVVGGEAKYRQLRGTITGVEATETAQPEGTAPDERWRPAVAGRRSTSRSCATPSRPVAGVRADRAGPRPRARRGRRPHRGRAPRPGGRPVGVVRRRRRAPTRGRGTAAGPAAAEIRDAGPGNRMISFPYTKRLGAQWNVDQAAAIVLCSADGRRRASASPRDRWVFPHALDRVEPRAVGRRSGARSTAAPAPRSPRPRGARAGRHRRRRPRPGRPLQLLPVRGASCSPTRSGCPLDDPGRPLDRHRRPHLRRRPAQQLRAPGHGRRWSSSSARTRPARAVEQRQRLPGEAGVQHLAGGAAGRSALPPRGRHRRGRRASPTRSRSSTPPRAAARSTGVVATATVDIADGEPVPRRRPRRPARRHPHHRRPDRPGPRPPAFVDADPIGRRRSPSAPTAPSSLAG